jgi:hypothetical protein
MSLPTLMMHQPKNQIENNQIICHNGCTTHPLLNHSVDFCLGRKNRLLAVFSCLQGELL